MRRQQGDRADFAEFVSARSPALHRAAYLLVGAAQRPRNDADLELFTCAVPSGDCEQVVASVGTIEEFDVDGTIPHGRAY